MTTTTVTRTLPSVATVSVATLPTHSEQSICDIVCDFFQENIKDVARGIGHGFAWTARAFPHNGVYSSISRTAGDIGNFANFAELPKRAATVASNINAFVTKPSVQTGRDVVSGVADVIDASCDGISLSANWIPFTPQVLKNVNILSCGAAFVGCGNSAVQQVQKISQQKEVDKGKTALYLINMARDVSYVAFGAFGVLSMGLSMPLAPWVCLACLTSGLLFTVGGHFFERIVNPEKKHFDKDRIIANLIAQSV
jgi:hypothetical protein